MVSLKSIGILALSVVISAPSLADDLCEGVVIRQQTVARAKPGDAVEYRISIHHSGDCVIRGMEITNYLPQDAEWLGADPQPDETQGGGFGSRDPWPVNRLKWKDRSLRPEESLELKVRIRVPEMKTGWMRNAVCVSGPGLLRRCGDVETFVRRD